jgi:hypothetical protein
MDGKSARNSSKKVFLSFETAVNFTSQSPLVEEHHGLDLYYFDAIVPIRSAAFFVHDISF